MSATELTFGISQHRYWGSYQMVKESINLIETIGNVFLFGKPYESTFLIMAAD